MLTGVGLEVLKWTDFVMYIVHCVVNNSSPYLILFFLKYLAFSYVQRRETKTAKQNMPNLNLNTSPAWTKSWM